MENNLELLFVKDGFLYFRNQNYFGLVPMSAGNLILRALAMEVQKTEKNSAFDYILNNLKTIPVEELPEKYGTAYLTALLAHQSSTQILESDIEKIGGGEITEKKESKKEPAKKVKSLKIKPEPESQKEETETPALESEQTPEPESQKEETPANENE